MIIITRSALDCQSVQQNNTQFVIFNCSLAKSENVQICCDGHLSTFTLPCPAVQLAALSSCSAVVLVRLARVNVMAGAGTWGRGQPLLRLSISVCSVTLKESYTVAFSLLDRS